MLLQTSFWKKNLLKTLKVEDRPAPNTPLTKISIGRETLNLNRDVHAIKGQHRLSWS